ncbi:MAG: D-tyrosyl-tRNA(Tyr) deacylase [Phycisphaerae bacterium]|mgnify:CR=1 FL=1|nr:D-tyrosyl-tRNA(Tyr) deacylase [Phycisphaerae bacterium]|tara:strand:+ start:171 stop:614 length:444 start_codon:yes stop_codon:yes gene_type:complete
MIAVVQRVSKAQVAVAEPAFQSSIELGLVVLLCIQREDTQEDAAWMAGKIARLRVFPDEQQRFDRSVQDVQGDVLLISQFTLAGDCSKGNRPSFISAAEPEHGRQLCDEVEHLLQEEHHIRVRTGMFQASMQVSLVNEGPATFIIER